MKRLVLIALLSTTAGCSHTGDGPEPSAARGSILFVHGAFQNDAVWRPLQKHVEALGFKTNAVELPREVTDTGPRLTDYVRRILERGASMPSPVWLVVHSFGGMHGTVAAASKDDPFEGIVYIAAYAPLPGESMQALAARDTTNRFTERNFVVSKDYRYASVLEEDRVMLFCNDCSPDLAQTVAKEMLFEPLAPIAEKVEFDREELSDDKIAYVFTTADNAVGTKLQREMAARAGIQTTVEIATGHTPFLTRPKELAERLVSLLIEFGPARISSQ